MKNIFSLLNEGLIVKGYERTSNSYHADF